MTPAENVSPAFAASAVSANVLGDGEVILLAKKPSIFYIVLESWTVLALAIIILAWEYFWPEMFHTELARRAVGILCAAAATIRLAITGIQWAGKLYVLTDRRVLEMRGVFTVDVHEILLVRIRQTSLSVSVAQKMLGLGSILLHIDEEKHPASVWLHMRRPTQVEKLIRQAVQRARGRG